MRQEMLRVENLIAESEQGIRISHIDLNVYKSETVALMESNGSCKSILLDILSGKLPILSGNIFINEKRVNLFNPEISNREGIYIITQKSALIDDLTISENIFVIRNNSFKKIMIPGKLIYSQTLRLLSSIGLKLDPNIHVRALSEAQKHLVELIKAVSSGAKIVIFERNFSSYSSLELIFLQAVLQRLKKDGLSFIICCEYFEEVQFFSNKVVFFRDGQISKKMDTVQLKEDMIEKYMVNFSLKMDNKDSLSTTKDIAFEVKNLVLNESVPPINLYVKQGETVVVNGFDIMEREKLFCLLSGREHQESMMMYLNGKQLYYKNIHGLHSKKIVSISSLGNEDELLGNLSIEENILLPSMKKASGILGFVSNKLTKLQMTIGNGIIDELNNSSVKELNRNERIAVLLERWYIYHPQVVIMFEPFLKCDINGQNLIFDFMSRLTKEGTAFILIVSSTRKIEDKCDRILTIKNGEIIKGN